MTIALEYVERGDWDAVNRAVDTLRSLVLDTGGRSLGLRFGTTTVTWAGGTDPSGGVTVTHGLGRTPAVILLTCGPRSDGSDRTYASYFSVGATTFGVIALATVLNPAAGVTCSVSWVVIG